MTGAKLGGKKKREEEKSLQIQICQQADSLLTSCANWGGGRPGGGGDLSPAPEGGAGGPYFAAPDSEIEKK